VESGFVARSPRGDWIRSDSLCPDVPSLMETVLAPGVYRVTCSNAAGKTVRVEAGGTAVVDITLPAR
jgi:hypothetical protein